MGYACFVVTDGILRIEQNPGAASRPTRSLKAAQERFLGAVQRRVAPVCLQQVRPKAEFKLAFLLAAGARRIVVGNKARNSDPGDDLVFGYPGVTPVQVVGGNVVVRDYALGGFGVLP